jgi:hypothetical protein
VDWWYVRHLPYRWAYRFIALAHTNWKKKRTKKTGFRALIQNKQQEIRGSIRQPNQLSLSRFQYPWTRHRNAHGADGGSQGFSCLIRWVYVHGLLIVIG